MELKPCPFCGGRAGIQWDGERYSDAWIECDDCDGRGGAHPDIQAAIDAWNNRYNEPQHEVLNEQAKE